MTDQGVVVGKEYLISVPREVSAPQPCDPSVSWPEAFTLLGFFLLIAFMLHRGIRG